MDGLAETVDDAERRILGRPTDEWERDPDGTDPVEDGSGTGVDEEPAE